MNSPSDAERSNERSHAPAAGEQPLGETQDLSQAGYKPQTVPTNSPSTAPETWVGRHLGKYEVRALLGVGGMGVVYRAHDTLIERDVALKILSQEFSRDDVNVRRFLSEAKAAGKLTHPNAVAIYEVGQEGQLYYLVMEYVSGGSTADQLEKAGTLSVLEATRIVLDACRGLGAAHAVGLIHRDIKPANLLRASDGTVKVADFGLAKLTFDTTRELTQMGHIVGTPYFMSPEQCESKPLDPRTDIYSLGATYFSLLTGANPYQEFSNVVQVMYAHCTGEILDPRKTNPAVPLACSQIIARATAKRPEDRYQNAAEMQADLNAVIATLSGAAGIPLPSQSGNYASQFPASIGLHPLTTHPRRSRSKKLIALAGIAALVFGVLGYFTFDDLTHRDHPAGAATAGSEAPAIPAPTGEPIKIGVLHSLTGTMAESESAVVESTLLAVDQINQAGGLLGRPVEALVRDGGSDPKTFAEQADKLINEDQVCTVFGCWTSASRRTVVPIFEKHNHLLVYPLQYEGLEQSPNVIYLGATPNQQIVPAVEWAFAFQHKRRFFLVGSDYIFPRMANTIIRDVVADLGGQIVGEEYLPLGDYETQPIIEKIVAAKPDVILNTINGDSNVPFFKQLRGAGITPEVASTISFSIGEEEIRHLRVAEMVGDFASWNYFQSIKTPENQAFVAAFRAKYGPQRVLTDPMEAAFIGVHLWGQAVTQAKSAAVAEIRQAFQHQSMLAPEGEVRIDPITHHAFKTPRIGQITPDGQFEIVWKAVKPQPPVPYPTVRSAEAWNAFLEKLYANWGNQWSAPAR